MRHVDVVLQDDVTVPTVYQALARRHPDSRSHGRPGFAAEGCVALLDPQARAQLELRGLEHEARANLVYRDFNCARSEAPDRVPWQWSIMPRRALQHQTARYTGCLMLPIQSLTARMAHRHHHSF
jgi:hypothetical protein